MNPTPSKMSEVIFRMAAAMGKVAQDTENQELYGPSMLTTERQMALERENYITGLKSEENPRVSEGGTSTGHVDFNPSSRVNHSSEALKTDAQSLQARVLNILASVSCGTELFGTEGKFIVTISGSTCLLFYKWKGLDIANGTRVPLTTRKYYISPHMLDVELVQTAFLCLKTTLEHELRESFKYKGVAIFGPHLDLDVLTTVTTKERIA